MRLLPIFLVALLLGASCAKPEPPKSAEAVSAELAQGEPTALFWGDTHLHTSYSPDAYFFGNASADPDTAHRWAKGLPVAHPYTKARVRIGTPLDFLVVADHAEMMGVPNRLFAGDEGLAQTASGKRFIRMMEQGKNQDIFFEFITSINDNEPFDDLNTPELRDSLWAEHVDFSERHNEPGLFTSLIGWEWTSTPNGKNLHRVVFMPEDGGVAKKFTPYSAFDSDKPEDLWAWLDETSKETGASFLAIPHNPNISGGLMFDSVDSEGRPITADYARTRMRWEPVVEIVQIKGDSETHPALSPNDEFAGFEPFGHMIDTAEIKSGAAAPPKADPGDYVRSALKRGLEIEQATGVNPYKVGVIGSTDSHTGLASAEEDNFWGKTAFDSTPENTFATFLDIKGFGADMSAAGLAGVWAEQNTREALFSAFQRREVYASSGPRIRVRFFGGWGFSEDDAKAKNMAQVGYSKGVPMGGDLTEAPKDKAPEFLVYAVKDPKGANLDRVQLVKGWIGADGVAREKVYNVAWSNNREQLGDGSIPDLENTVDLATGSYGDKVGATQLATRWRDPDFDPSQRAFYYVRVLQIATPRHTLYDAIALQMDPAKTGHPSTIQERAYSSPIWYTP
jgi:hypothetical protein